MSGDPKEKEKVDGLIALLSLLGAVLAIAAFAVLMEHLGQDTGMLHSFY